MNVPLMFLVSELISNLVKPLVPEIHVIGSEELPHGYMLEPVSCVPVPAVR